MFQFYVWTWCILHSQYFPPWLYKTDLLVSRKAKVAVFLRSTQNTQTLCVHHVELLNVKPDSK
jgi:hypothetical protein